MVVVLSRSYDSATLRDLTPLVISVVDWVDFSVARKPFEVLLPSFCVFINRVSSFLSQIMVYVFLSS